MRLGRACFLRGGGAIYNRRRVPIVRVTGKDGGVDEGKNRHPHVLVRRRRATGRPEVVGAGPL